MEAESQTAPAGEAARPALVDRPILRRARALVLWALGAAIVYSALVASKGSCPGGFAMDGGFLDANGDPTDVQPQCIQLMLQPSPVVYLAIALTVVIALGRAARAVDVDAALRTLNRAVIIVVAIAVVSMVVAILWFQAIPSPAERGTILFPFPFGGGTMTTTPQDPGPVG
ncbi:hypothetical protein [Leifsonia sp. NPDC077715]|uniref:hypothetical protein n=1 Tax=Leifsonia sp. NPDC077715 TaxID=3155539 RepID=UPI00342164F5